MSNTGNKIPSVGEVSTLIVTVSFFVSLMYNFAYFWAAGVPLSSAPVATIDVINTALIWGPIVALLLGAATIFQLMLDSVAPGIFTKKIIKDEASHKRSKKYRFVILLFALGYPLAMAMLYIIFGQTIFSPAAGYGAFPILWIALGQYLSQKNRSNGRRRFFFEVLIIYVPIIITTSLFYGYNQSLEQLSQNNSEFTVYKKNNNQVIEGVYVRSLDKGIIIKDVKGNNLLFFPWSEIGKLERKYERRVYQGLVCIFFRDTFPARLKNFCSKSIIDDSIVVESVNK